MRGTHNVMHVPGGRNASGEASHLKSLDDAELVAGAGSVKYSYFVDKHLRVMQERSVR